MIGAYGGGQDDFRALVYGERNVNTLNYLQNQVSNIGNYISDATRNFFANTREIYDRYNGEEVLRSTRAALRKAGSIFQSDIIREMTEIGEIQNAPPIMRRFIMAEPTVRMMYHDQRIAGFDDGYVDVDPKDVGEDHYDYRRATNGFIPHDSKSDTVVVYFDDLRDGDRELELEEQIAIHDTWSTVKHLLKVMDRDPTSQSDESL